MGAPEPVDGLHVVAHRGDVRIVAVDELEQMALCVVRVLVLVEENDRMTFAELGRQPRVAFDELHGETDLIAEVDAALVVLGSFVGVDERAEVEAAARRTVHVGRSPADRQQSLAVSANLLDRDEMICTRTTERECIPDERWRVAGLAMEDLQAVQRPVEELPGAGPVEQHGPIMQA